MIIKINEHELMIRDPIFKDIMIAALCREFIEDHEQGESIYITFTEDEKMTRDFADEFVGVLYARSGKRVLDRIQFINAGEAIWETINDVILSRYRDEQLLEAEYESKTTH